MKSILLLFFVVNFSTLVYAQGGEYDDVYSSDAFEPKFNGGGLNKLYEFINQQFDYSKVTKAGKMLISFTIDEQGELKNLRVLEYNDIQSATEIIRVLNEAPKWESAKRGGKPFKVDIKLPLEFNVKIKSTTAQQSVKSSESINQTVSSSQNKSDAAVKIKTDENKVKSTETAPGYPSGLKKFYQFISENYRTPDVQGLKGKVVVSFIVDIDGSLTNFMIEKDLGYGTGKEVIRVLKKSPKWTPDTQNGIPVRVLYSLPINIASSFVN